MAFVLGAAMGAAAGVLLAPASGLETRTRLRQRGAESAQRGRDALAHTKDVVREKVDNVREQMSSVSDAAHSRLDAARNAVAEGKAAYQRELERPAL
jgi:gas vesicle protein